MMPHAAPSSRSRRSRAVLALAALAAAGCGYGLVGRVSNLPPDLQTIYLHPLENRTTRQLADQILSEAIAGEMVNRQRLRSVPSRAQADAELDGSLTGFGVIPVAFDEEGRATTYQIQITVAVRFRRTDSGEVIWQRDQYSFRESYEIEVSETGFFDREILALREVSSKFAETLVTDLFEGF